MRPSSSMIGPPSPSIRFACLASCLSGCPSVHPSIRLSITPFSQCSCHFIMKFSEIIANDVMWSPCKRSRSEVKGHFTVFYKTNLSQFGNFWTITPVWTHRWLPNDAKSLKWHRKDALLFFKVNCKISRSHRQKNQQILIGNEHFQIITPVEFTDSYEMMHKAWSCTEDVTYCFSWSSLKFQDLTVQEIDDLARIWAFPDDNSSLNTQMAMKWYT